MKNAITMLLLVILLFFVLPTYADTGGPSLPSDPDNAPIDGGLSVVLAAGTGYGARKLKEKRKNNFLEKE